MYTLILEKSYEHPCPWQSGNYDIVVRTAYTLRARGYDVAVVDTRINRLVSEVCDYNSDLDSRAHAVADWLEDSWLRLN